MYLVCKHKDTGGLFITTRKARETMLSVLIDMKQEVGSYVVKEFNTYEMANNYKIEIEVIDLRLKTILN